MFKTLLAIALAFTLHVGSAAAHTHETYMAAMDKMNHTMMSMKMTGDPTRDFVLMMIPHHQSAIDMAEALLKEPDADADIKAMAEKIISDQQMEIDQLNAWLGAHKQ
jgi:uncharacterized protein (DUF305 family)